MVTPEETTAIITAALCNLYDDCVVYDDWETTLEEVMKVHRRDFDATDSPEWRPILQREHMRREVVTAIIKECQPSRDLAVHVCGCLFFSTRAQEVFGGRVIGLVNIDDIRYYISERCDCNTTENNDGKIDCAMCANPPSLFRVPWSVRLAMGV